MIRSVEIRGFKSFANGAQELELSPALTVIHGENSQGKTSLAEAFEFLFSGTISRRMLSGGSPQEFDGALKNVLLEEGIDAYVTASFEGEDGALRALKRLLVEDFVGASQCVSKLTLDDLDIESASDGGFELSPAPLPTAVLMEHALRYAVSAKPGERSEFFRAVLDLADVDGFVSAVDGLIASRSRAGVVPTSLAELRQLRSVPGMGGLESIENHVSAVGITESLAKVFLSKFPFGGAGSPAEDSEEWEDLLLRVEREMEALRTEVISLKPLVTTMKRLPADVPADYVNDGSATTVLQIDSSKRQVDGVQSVVTAYETWRATSEDVARHRKLLLTADQVYEEERKDQAHKPEDCPLCGAPDAFTRERLLDIHEQLLKQSDGIGAVRSVEKFVRELERIGNSVIFSAKELTPEVSLWNEEARTDFENAVEEVGGDASALRKLFEAYDKVYGNLSSIESAKLKLAQACSTVSNQIDSNAELRVEHIQELEATWDAIASEVDASNAALDSADRLSKAFLNDIEPLVDSRADIKEWAALLEMSRDISPLVSDLQEFRAEQAVDRRLQAAKREITKAVSVVLNLKVDRMAEEIRRWWRLLRPHDQEAFSDLSPRGKGVRYLDLVAAFANQHDGTVAKRNPLAVFSASQMNALGLASFIARARLIGSPFIFLDDPVAGSDREHRLSFATSVVSELLAEGVQVIISTHDSELARMLQALYQHEGVSMYGVTLEDRVYGSRVDLLKSKFEELMADAKSQMHSPLRLNRRSAGISLRTAAEQLAKRIIVHERIASGEAGADVSDYDGKNLKDLRPEVGGYAQFPDEVGKWEVIVRELNDAGHDVEPPTSGALKVAFDTLRDLRKKHRLVSLI